MTEEQKKKMEALASARINPNKKSLKNREDQELLSLIEYLCEVEAYVQAIHNFGVDLTGLEAKYIGVIEFLLIKSYGEEVANIITWWVFDSITIDGEILPLIDEKGKEHIIMTPSQLFKFLKKHIIK